MPDIASARPIAGQPIETAWGTEVQDAVEGVQGGLVNCVWSGTADANVPVVFPRPYLVPPIVVVCTHTGVTRIIRGAVIAGTITTTGFSYQGSRTDGTTMSGSVPFTWIAIGIVAP